MSVDGPDKETVATSACVGKRDYVDGFDRMVLRSVRGLTRAERKLLNEHSSSCTVHKGKPLRGYEAPFLITVVAPDATALECLASRTHTHVNAVEVARDYHAQDPADRNALQDLFDAHFVQGWHGSQDVVRDRGTTYTREEWSDTKYVWYADRASKFFGGPCLHLEGRHQGMASVRRAGIESLARLINFDFSGYWNKRLRLFEVDFERLGRLHANRIEGRRRQSKRSWRHGMHSYNIDKRTGQMLFRAVTQMAGHDLGAIQRFVDRFGRGQFLVPIEARIDNMRETMKSRKRLQ